MTNPVLYHWFVLGLAAVLFVTAAITDAWRYRIPNAISLALLLLFPLYVLTAPEPVAWKDHLIFFALTLLGGYALYIKKFAGAGDIKLLAVTGLWAGAEWFLVFLFITSLTGGLLAMVMTVLTYWRHRTRRSKETLALAKVPIPYGVAIATGGLCTLVLLSHKVPFSV